MDIVAEAVLCNHHATGLGAEFYDCLSLQKINIK